MLFDEEGDINSRRPITGKGEGRFTVVGIVSFCIEGVSNGTESFKLNCNLLK